jgi:hypothetical protein
MTLPPGSIRKLGGPNSIHRQQPKTKRQRRSHFSGHEKRLSKAVGLPSPMASTAWRVFPRQGHDRNKAEQNGTCSGLYRNGTEHTPKGVFRLFRLSQPRGGCKCLKPPPREPAYGVQLSYSGRKKVCTLAIAAKLFANLLRFAIFGPWLHRLDGKRFDRHRVMRDSGFKGRALPDPFPV